MTRLQRPDATILFIPPVGADLDTTALHTEAAAIGQRLTPADLSGRPDPGQTQSQRIKHLRMQPHNPRRASSADVVSRVVRVI